MPAGADRVLAEPLALPLRPLTEAAVFGPTLVIAPHQDDESLGCGGAIAALRRFGLPVWVVFVTDGAGASPRSRTDALERLRASREAEALAALEALDVTPAAVTFLGLTTGAVPSPSGATFAVAVERLCTALATTAPATVLLPWRRDPDPDNRATWHLARAVLAALGARPRLLEYPVWIWERAEAGALPVAGEVEAWRLDIGAVLPLKLTAIMAHRSQTTNPVTGSPEGVPLAPAVLAHFARSWELFLEPLPGAE